MIRYTLKCAQDHAFESWFKSADAYESLRLSGLVACPLCGDNAVEKSLMAPAVRLGGKADPKETAPPTAPSEAEIEKAIAAMREQVEKNSEYVGVNFVAEARKMHEGDVPERSIYGEAKPEEARKLLEDGVPIAPLPFLPKRRAN
jgi:hypothetical protein